MIDANTATDAVHNAVTDAEVATENATAADADNKMLSQITRVYSQDLCLPLHATQHCLRYVMACSTEVMRLFEQEFLTFLSSGAPPCKSCMTPTTVAM